MTRSKALCRGLVLVGSFAGITDCRDAIAQTQPPTVVTRREAAVTISNDSIRLRFVDVELRVVVEALGQYLAHPIVIPAMPSARITLQTPAPYPRGKAIDLLRGALDGQGFDLRLDSASIYRVTAREGVNRPAIGQPLQGVVTGPMSLTVLRLRHSRALDVAATVNALYGRASSFGEVGQSRSSTLSQQLKDNRLPPGMPSATGAPNTPSQSSGAFSGDVIIVPDEVTNSLMVRSSPTDLALVRAAVEQLDIRPLQVLIEVLIVEARRDKSLAYGLDLSLPDTKLSPDGRTKINASTQGVGLSDFVLKVMGAGGVNLDATLRAAATNGNARIVSRPILLATNNESASILVGSQRPFVQVQRSLATDGGSRDQVVQYKDVGTELTVRPTVSADGYVTLEVTQQVNSATSETAFDAPVISTRSLQTKLVVRDSQTIVLGGLSDNQRDASQGGVPFLSSIPFIGGLFGRRTSHASETELLLFLTPRVIRNDDEVKKLSDPLRERAKPGGS